MGKNGAMAQSMGGDMQTTQYPPWERVLMFLGVVAPAAVCLSVTWSLFSLLLWAGLQAQASRPGLDYLLYPCASVVLSVGVLAAAVRLQTARRPKATRRMLAMGAGIAMVVALSVGAWFSTGEWWLGYLGVSNPLPVQFTCDGPVSGPGWDSCAHHIATMTAEAPHPPDWLPWGR